MTCVKPAKLSRRVTKSQQKKIKKTLLPFFISQVRNIILFLKYGTSFYFSSTEHHFIFCEVRNTVTAGAETKFFWKKEGLTAQTRRP